MTDRLTTFSHDRLTFDVIDTGPIDGRLIIALHGFPQRGSSWAKVTPHLVAAGYRVLAPDQRGYSAGARPAEIAAYRMDRLAGDVLALADAAEADTCHVLGHDWGGGVAWYLGSRHPDRVRTLSVASTPHPRAMIASMKGTQLLRSSYILAFQIPKLPELVLRAGHGAMLRRWLRASGPLDLDEAVATLADPQTATGALNWYRSLRLRDAPTAGKVTVPTLYVWSDGDLALGRRAATATAHWVTGPYQFEILEGVSHWIPDERPEELAELVLRHVARHS